MKRARKVIPDLLEMWARLDPQDLLALTDLLGIQGLLGLLALLDPKETLETRVLRVRRVIPELLDPKDHRAMLA